MSAWLKDIIFTIRNELPVPLRKTQLLCHTFSHGKEECHFLINLRMQRVGDFHSLNNCQGTAVQDPVGFGLLLFIEVLMEKMLLHL